jgi:hypothetical protein
MNRALIHRFWFDEHKPRRSTAGKLRSRAAIILAALVIPNALAATARADATYSATLDASLTVSGFLDAERNPISKPEGLTLESETFFLPDSFTDGDATADVDGAFGVTVGDPFDLGAGDRLEFTGVVSGTTVYPTGYSIAAFLGFSEIFMDNATPDPVTISFDVSYDYMLSASVDNPDLEYAAAVVGYAVFTDFESSPEEFPFLFNLFTFVEYDESDAAMGAESFEVTLSAGQTRTISVSAHVIGDPESITVPEPTSWLLGSLGVVLLLGAPRPSRRLSSAQLHR